MIEACQYCDNARINEELTDNNDYSSVVVACNNNYRTMLSSGWGRPVRLEVEIYEKGEWRTITKYYPKFCPECGRKIVEYERGDKNAKV